LNYLYFNLNLTVNTISYIYFFILIVCIIHGIILDKKIFKEIKYILSSVFFFINFISNNF
jgi:hypothetical protein